MDFRILARPKMDAVILGATAIRKSKKYKDLVYFINTSNSLPALKRKSDQL